MSRKSKDNLDADLDAELGGAKKSTVADELEDDDLDLEVDGAPELIEAKGQPMRVVDMRLVEKEKDDFTDKLLVIDFKFLDGPNCRADVPVQSVFASTIAANQAWKLTQLAKAIGAPKDPDTGKYRFNKKLQVGTVVLGDTKSTKFNDGAVTLTTVNPAPESVKLEFAELS